MESSQNISSIAESFYKGTQVINNFCETEIIPKLKSNKSQEDKDIAITGIYYRMFLLVSSASLLNSYKYYQSIASFRVLSPITCSNNGSHFYYSPLRINKT
jgi:hypothetical protein